LHIDLTSPCIVEHLTEESMMVIDMSNLSPEKKLEAALNGLMRSAPFWAVPASGAKYVPDSTCRTLWVNVEYINKKRQITIGYDPQRFVAAEPLAVIEFGLAHEICHVELKHHTRRKGRDFETWQQACDYEANALLKHAGWQVPSFALYNPKFDGMSVEQIYDVLKAEKDKKQQEQDEQKKQEQQQEQASGSDTSEDEQQDEQADEQEQDENKGSADSSDTSPNSDSSDSDSSSDAEGSSDTSDTSEGDTDENKASGSGDGEGEQGDNAEGNGSGLAHTGDQDEQDEQADNAGSGSSSDASEDYEEGNTSAEDEQAPDNSTYFGEVRDMSVNGADATDEQKLEEQQTIEVMTHQAAQIARKAGNMPGYLSAIVDFLTSPAVDWRTALASWINEAARSDYSWARPSRRYSSLNIPMPSLTRKELGKIAIALDTSGSVMGRKEMVEEIVAEVQSLFETFNIPAAIFIPCDTRVIESEVQELGPTDELDLSKIYGGGGTDFRGPFSWIEQSEENIIGLIYLTDGECWSFPANEPDYKVMWFVAKGGYQKFQVPFGEIVSINE
jgi:predicted metal-dependent peptidase